MNIAGWLQARRRREVQARRAPVAGAPVGVCARRDMRRLQACRRREVQARCAPVAGAPEAGGPGATCAGRNTFRVTYGLFFRRRWACVPGATCAGCRRAGGRLGLTRSERYCRLHVEQWKVKGANVAPSPLTSHPSPLTSHLSPLTSHPSPLTPHLSPLTPPAPVTFFTHATSNTAKQ